MNRTLKNILFGILPVVGIVTGGIWYQRSSEEAIAYHRNFQVLKSACEESAGKDIKSSDTLTKYIGGVCECFAKSALHQHTVTTAGVVSDQRLVHSILKECSTRLPANQ